MRSSGLRYNFAIASSASRLTGRSGIFALIYYLTKIVYVGISVVEMARAPRVFPSVRQARQKNSTSANFGFRKKKSCHGISFLRQKFGEKKFPREDFFSGEKISSRGERISSRGEKIPSRGEKISSRGEKK